MGILRFVVCGAKRISKANKPSKGLVLGAGAVQVLSKVDKQRLGAWLGAVLGVKQGCGSIQDGLVRCCAGAMVGCKV